MSNTPTKTTDPTEAALSAIQDALSIRDNPPATDGGSEPPAPPTTAESIEIEPSAPQAAWDGVVAADGSHGNGNGFDAAVVAEEPLALRPAADGERESISQILDSLQQRPARTSYLMATVFALLWVFAGLSLGWLYLPEIQVALGPTGLAVPVLAVLGAVFFVPIVFFYVLAHMAWRSQELRIVTQSMAEVAMRLAEPEAVAHESIVTVGQAIRREVAAMGDGVERALARAAELETLVANEV
jgi:hypothetical protein